MDLKLLNFERVGQFNAENSFNRRELTAFQNLNVSRGLITLSTPSVEATLSSFPE